MSELKKLTRLGSNSKQLAALLQAKAPKGHSLAYINPREAAILKAHGGSGHPHADTGIPSYDDGMEGFDMTQPVPNQIDVTQAPEYASSQLAPVDTSSFNYGGGFSYPTASSGTGMTFNALPTVLPTTAETAAAEYAPSASQLSYTGPAGGVTAPQLGGVNYGVAGVGTPSAPALAYGGQQATPITTPTTEATKPSWGERATDYFTSPDTLAKLGLGTVQALIGARAAKRAEQQGQQGAQQMQQLAAPYQQAGANIQAAASRGELTPQGQQSLQAAQAQAAQAVANRGGVGAAQAAQNVEAFRQQLLQQQYDYGLKLSGIGDNIALGAIKTGLQADQYAQQLTNSYYSNIARTLYGTSTPRA